ncbi:hypothetical protein [Amycolatopsis benzoatilytica]|uniref:hypothetical protein n=1 Tax=Amycolatopsis benzoatilytica TaxID=346045 RepID=UPI00037B387F|nr:hypothetical protein [Amycolatopsis benzoatilytica]
MTVTTHRPDPALAETPAQDPGAEWTLDPGNGRLEQDRTEGRKRFRRRKTVPVADRTFD